MTRDLFPSAWKDERGILHPDSGREHSGALAIHVSKVSTPARCASLMPCSRPSRTAGGPFAARRIRNTAALGSCSLAKRWRSHLVEKIKRFEHPKEFRRVTTGHGCDRGHGPYTTILTAPYPPFGYEQLGQLALRIPGYSSPKFQVADGATKWREDRLDEFLWAWCASPKSTASGGGSAESANANGWRKPGSVKSWSDCAPKRRGASLPWSTRRARGERPWTFGPTSRRRARRSPAPATSGCATPHGRSGTRASSIPRRPGHQLRRMVVLRSEFRRGDMGHPHLALLPVRPAAEGVRMRPGFDSTAPGIGCGREHT